MHSDEAYSDRVLAADSLEHLDRSPASGEDYNRALAPRLRDAAHGVDDLGPVRVTANDHCLIFSLALGRDNRFNEQILKRAPESCSSRRAHRKHVGFTRLDHEHLLEGHAEARGAPFSVVQGHSHAALQSREGRFDSE